MEMTINVKVDVSERVVALVERLLAGVTPPKPAEVTAPAAAQAKAVETAKEAVETLKEAVEAAPAKAAKVAVQAPTAKAAAPTAEDVRQAMIETRKRIIGAGWDDPESDAYKFYHRTLVSMFKTTATLHGAAKPSQLAEDERQAFIDDLGRIYVDEKGKLGSKYETDPLPF